MNSAALPWHKQFWPWFLIVLPAIAVIASFTSLYIAVVNRDSLVRDNYYKDGLAINAEIDQDKAAQTRGIVIDGVIDHLGISLTLTGSFTQLPQTLVVQFMHPLIDKKDFTIELKRNSLGNYVGTLPFALTGRWHVEIGSASDAQWRARRLLDFTDTANFRITE